MLNILIIGVILIMYLVKLLVSVLNYKNRHQPLPELVQEVYDESKYETWLSYTMDNFKFQLITSALNTAILITFLVTGLFGVFESIAIEWTSSVILQSVIFVLIYLGIRFVVNIPFGYYRRFVIEARYGFNRSTLKTFILDQIKTILFGGLVITGLISLLMRIYLFSPTGFLWIGWIAIVMISLLIIGLQTKVFLKIFNKLTPLEEGSLKTKIEAFVTKTGYKIKAISTMDASKRSTKLNAFFSGFGQLKDIVLFDTLVDKLEEDEIVAVLAHEVAHGKHKDVLRLFVQQIIMYGLYIYLISLAVSSDILATSFGLSGAHFGFGLIMFFILFEPVDLLIGILTNHLSRIAEFKADRFAAKQGYKAEMKQALITLSRENFSNLTPHPLYVWLYYTHPTLAERLRNIEMTA